MSPYNYAANSPIILVDPNGKWIADIKKGKDNNYYIVFIAEEGDNLSTLEIQMGLGTGDLEAHVSKRTIRKIKNGKELRLSSLEIVQNINNYLNFDKLKSSNKNCSQLADAISKGEIPNGSPSEHMTKYYGTFESEHVNVEVSKSQTGDVVRYIATREIAEKYGKSYLDFFSESKLVNDLYEKSDKKLIKPLFVNKLLGPELTETLEGVITREEVMEIAKENEIIRKFLDEETKVIEQHWISETAHFSIVILKSKNGKNIKQVLEDDVGHEFDFKIHNYPTNFESYEPAPSPTYKKKE